MNYKLKISYDGSNYCGWQIQPKKKTIQGELEISLYKVFNKKINLIGSGRTDSGVHAYGQIANFHVDTEISSNKIQDAINANLNDDIFIISCDIENEEFHARFSAKKRMYEYNILKGFNIFSRKYEWSLKWKNINHEKLKKCSNMLIGEYDFSNFCKASSKKDNNICIISYSKWTFNKNVMKYDVEANRFLHHMVRFLVGTMIEVARGKISLNDFSILLNNNNNKARIISAPAKGLFLKKIHY